MIDRVPGDPQLWLAVAGVFALLVLASRVAFVRVLLNLTMFLAVAVLVVMLVSERERIDPWMQRFGLAGTDQRVVGDELRVPMSADGHFWVRARIDGVERRMLVDSGATVTALGDATAARAGLGASAGLAPVLIRTANGTVAARSAEIGELRLGNIVARDLGAVVSPAFGNVDVLGMNFLSRLKGWRVEQRTLILTPHHPQAEAR